MKMLDVHMSTNSDSSTTTCTVVQDTNIVRAEIHPAIGVARLGSSINEFFISPQVVEPAPQAPGFYRDALGALKREAAQFRIYGYNAAGQVVRELTAGDADIVWSAHVANQKAAWYQWVIAMDIPEAASTVLSRRNPNLATAAARDTLVIDTGRQTVSGANASAAACVGSFTGVPVYLGELQTDEKGRLLFLPGLGISASPTGSPIYTDAPNAFINADGWYDDTCDGPVMAEVKVDGRAIPVQSAWVITTPPNYAPQVKAERTMYDLMNDLFVQAGWVDAPLSVSFARDVYPILQRLSGLQWVNQGFATQYGLHGRYHFEDPAYIAQLAAKPVVPGGFDPNTEVRRQLLNSFRNPIKTDSNQTPWPWIYGDAMEVPAGDSPRQNASVTDLQFAILERWVDGDFENDWGASIPPSSIDAVPLAEQPAMLTRAAMEFCLADAFHPGCEMTWPMRHLSMYSKPFRIRQRPAGVAAPQYGSTLDQQQCLAANGPLHLQGPGDLTRWMGLPWQADTAYCRGGYDPNYDPYAPTFWPARVPNQVLTERDYAIVIDSGQPLVRRVEAFTQRTSWNKPLHGTTSQQMDQMVRIFGSMGLVEVREGVKDDPAFPSVMMVASYGPDVAPADAAETANLTTPGLLKTAQGAPTASTDKHELPRGANFTSREEARNAPRPGVHRRR
jgi:hypothetical protein